MIYACCERNRLDDVRAHATANGIAFLEVLDREAPAGSPRQRTLLVHCVKAIAALTRNNVRITGGDRIRNVGVVWAFRADLIPAANLNAAEQAFMAALPQPTQVLVVRTDSTGDHSTYRLHLQTSSGDPAPPPTFDPLCSSIDFSFKVECASEFDCRTDRTCAEPHEPGPDVDYLAKDYASFRRLMLDRIAQLVPGTRDHNPADFRVAITEMLAYVGDHLSYQQDAIATEAYLRTARRRTSLRRHALLVDYRVHEGANARAWVAVEVSQSNVPVTKADLYFLTRVAGLPGRFTSTSSAHEDAMAARASVFELVLEDPKGTVLLHTDHNEFLFYTWGDRRCCLPAGTTAATLEGHWPKLSAGDVLIFQEVKGPETGATGDANPAHRHAVRLNFVEHTRSGAPLKDELHNQQITEIGWDPADALPFPLCISSLVQKGNTEELLENVSQAFGNVLLTDHGRTIEDEPLAVVPPARITLAVSSGDPCARPERPVVPPRYTPVLQRQPLTWGGSIQKVTITGGKKTVARVAVDEDAPAAAAIRLNARDIAPVVRLSSKKDLDTHTWEARSDLLNSAASDPHFVPEIEDDGATRLRFSNTGHALRPDSGTSFKATYRVGNGPDGNVGADAVHHIVSADPRILKARNPLPAAGGTAPETKEQIRRRAPQAFRTQQRAVTPEDYARVTELHADVQRAAATLRWTGSWYTVFVTVDRKGGVLLDDTFKSALRRHVDRYRMAGHDLEFDDPRFVSIELDIQVCVAPEYFREHVKQALLRVFSRQALSDGLRGMFHPDNFSFGEPVYLSPLYAAAHAVPGVESVRIDKFQRQGVDDTQYLDDGKLSLGRLEIARLDNDPSFPEHGILRLNMGGGK